MWLRALLALTLLRLAGAALMPLSADEAYYWVWSRALAPGYVDHPPMVALFIRAGTALAGQGAFGIRLLAPLAAALASILLARAADALFPAEKPGLRAAILLNATLLFGGVAVTMTPDTPLLLFVCALLAAVARGQWGLAGIAAGLALDSKYTAFLLAPALLLWLAAHGGLRRPGPWRAGLIALALFAPVIAWNAGHDWASFAKQGGRLADWHPGRAAQYLVELIAAQLGLMTPLIALLFATGAWISIKRRRAAPRALLAACIVLPALVFAQHALGDRVQANWPGLLYPPLAIAAALIPTPLFRPAVALGFAMTALATIQAAFAPLPLRAAFDPTLTRLGGWTGLATDVERVRQTAGLAWIAADNYGIAALLAHETTGPAPVLGAEGRWSAFALPDGRPAAIGEGLLIRSARRADPPDPAEWASAAPIGVLTRTRNAMAAEQFQLYRVRIAPGATLAVLPRPH